MLIFVVQNANIKVIVYLTYLKITNVTTEQFFVKNANKIIKFKTNF